LRFGWIGKEIRKLCVEFFFSRPCSFFLGMMAPLYLAHLDPLVLSNSLRCF
jgi:hypothetical protein